MQFFAAVILGIFGSEKYRSSNAACAPGWDDVEGECLKIMPNDMFWENAKENCEFYRAALAPVKKTVVAEWIVTNAHGKPTWIGISDKGYNLNFFDFYSVFYRNYFANNFLTFDNLILTHIVPMWKTM